MAGAGYEEGGPSRGLQGTPARASSLPVPGNNHLPDPCSPAQALLGLHGRLPAIFIGPGFLPPSDHPVKLPIGALLPVSRRRPSRANLSRTEHPPSPNIPSYGSFPSAAIVQLGSMHGLLASVSRSRPSSPKPSGELHRSRAKLPRPPRSSGLISPGSRAPPGSPSMAPGSSPGPPGHHLPRFRLPPWPPMRVPRFLSAPHRASSLGYLSASSSPGEASPVKPERAEPGFSADFHAKSKMVRASSLAPVASSKVPTELHLA